MPWFHVTYRANFAPLGKDEDGFRPGNYGTWVWARSRRTVRDVCLDRGMGERPSPLINDGQRTPPYKFASQLLRQRMRGKEGLRQRFHALCYLAMIGLASGRITIQETLGDGGIVHDFAHGASRMKDLIARVEDIERRVPGYRPK